MLSVFSSSTAALSRATLSRVTVSSIAARAGLLFLVLALTLACGDGGEAPSGDSPKETSVVIAVTLLPSGINEYVSRGTVMDTAIEYFMLYLPLTEEQTDFQEGPASFLPRLAERWAFSDDRRKLTFFLREDAVWSDGVPITAADVRFTWQAQVHPDVGWFGATSIKVPIQDVEVVDDHTVVFHYEEAYANQLVDVSQGVILPAHKFGELPFSEWRDNQRWFIDNAVTSGPFTIETWQEGERIVLRKNERSLPEDRPAYDRLVLRQVTDENTRTAQLRAGEANFLVVDPGTAATLEGEEGIELLAWDYRQVAYVIWNLRRPLFQDARVRRALTMAIDRQAVIDTLYHGYAKPTTALYLRDAWVYNRDLEPLPFDPEAAIAQFAEAGWRDSDGDGVLDKGGEPFRFALETNTGSPVRANVVLMLQEQLRRVGVDAEVETYEFSTLLQRERAGNFDASFLGISVDTSWNLDALVHSEAIDSQSAFNLGAYSNPEVDALIDEIQTFVNPLEAKPLHDRLQAILYQDQPVTLMYQPQRIAALRGLTNVKPNMISPYANVRHWRLTDD